MRVSTAQIAQMVTQSLQGVKESGSLDLKVGNIVRATLLEILGNSDALIGIGAYKVRAKLDADLQVGDQMALLVTGEQKSGAMELKLVSDLTSSGAQQPAVDVQGLVKALGLPEEHISKTLVQEWLSRQLPLKQDVLQAASDVLQQLQKPMPQQVATLGKMVELGIPMHSGSFAAMDALDNGPKLHDLLANVMMMLQELLPENETSPVAATGNAAPETSASTQTANAVSETSASTQTANAVSETSASTQSANAAPQTNTKAPIPTERQTIPTSTSQALLDQVESTPQQAHSFPENKLSRFSTTTEGTARKPLSESVQNVLTQLAGVVRDLLAEGAQTLGDKAKQIGLGFEEHLGQVVRRLPAESDHAAIQAALLSASQVNTETGANLKQILLQAQVVAPELHAAGLEQLADDVGALLQNVTGQQMMQTPGQQERSDLIYQFAAVPTNVGGREQTVELHVMSRKGPNQKSLDPANCYVLFHLDMPNLGELDIHLHIVDKVVGVRFLSSGTDRVQITPDDQRDLWTAIRGVGFHLGTLKVEEKKPPTEGMQLPLLPPVLTQGAFDLRM